MNDSVKYLIDVMQQLIEASQDAAGILYNKKMDVEELMEAIQQAKQAIKEVSKE